MSRYDVIVVGAGSCRFVGRDQRRPGRAHGRCSSTAWPSWAARRPPCSTRSMPSTRRASRRAESSAASAGRSSSGCATRVSASSGRTRTAPERASPTTRRRSRCSGSGWPSRPARRSCSTRGRLAYASSTAAIEAIRTWNKGGERWIEAGVVVDASGDADVARDGWRGVRGLTHDRPGAVAVDVVPAGQRRRRPRAETTPRSAELWAMMRDGGRERRVPRCRDWRARGIERRSRAW